MMRNILATILVFLVLGLFVSAQDTSQPGSETQVQDQTKETDSLEMPAWVDDAIKLGLSKKKYGPYEIGKKMIGIKFTYATMLTPYIRVAMAASDARRKMMTFTRDNVTAEMLEPVAVCYIPPLMGDKVGDIHRSAEHIIIKKIKSKDPKDVIQPIKIVKEDKTFSTPLGVKVTKQAVWATFPLEALKEGFEFTIMYENNVLTKDTFNVKITKKTLKYALGE